MIRRAVFAWLACVVLLGCGDDSANQPGGIEPATYGKDASTADGASGACACDPMTMQFGQSDGFTVVAVTLSESAQSCTLSAVDAFSAAFGMVDPGTGELTGAFGTDWIPLSVSVGVLTQVQMGWQWTGIPFDTRVIVTMTHPSGIASTVEFEVNKSDVATLTILEACFHAA